MDRRGRVFVTCSDTFDDTARGASGFSTSVKRKITLVTWLTLADKQACPLSVIDTLTFWAPDTQKMAYFIARPASRTDKRQARWREALK
jgi:hypothetical protein